MNDILALVAKTLSPAAPENTVANTMAAIAREAGALLNGDELSQVRAAQARWQVSADAVLAHYDSEAKKAWLAHGATIAKRMCDGTFPADENVWTLDDWISDYTARREHAKEAMHLANVECLPLVEKGAKRFVKACEKLAAELEKQERDTAKRFCVEYMPSAALLRIGECAAQASVAGKTAPWGRTAPRDIAPFLNI